MLKTFLQHEELCFPMRQSGTGQTSSGIVLPVKSGGTDQLPMISGTLMSVSSRSMARAIGFGGLSRERAIPLISCCSHGATRELPSVSFISYSIKRWGLPHVLVTDKLGSYGAAKSEIAPDLEHHQHKGLNNRAEASHRHTRRREKIMGRFTSPRQAQRFLSAHDQVGAIFRPKRHRLSPNSYRHARADAFGLWNDYIVEW